MQLSLTLATALAAFAPTVFGQELTWASAIAYNGDMNGAICDGDVVGSAAQHSSSLDSVCSAAPGAKCVRWQTNASQLCTLWWCETETCFKDGGNCQRMQFEENAAGAFPLSGDVGSIEWLCWTRPEPTGVAKPRA